MPSSPTTVIGLGPATRDLIILASREAIAEFLGEWPLVDSVCVRISDDARNACQRFAYLNGHPSWSPGGTVANTLCAMATIRDHQSNTLLLSWSGPAEATDSTFADVALAHLQASRVRVFPDYRTSFVREAYCLIDRDSKELRRLWLFVRDAGLKQRFELERHDVAVITLADLVESAMDIGNYLQQCTGVVVLIGDWRPARQRPPVSEALQSLDNLRFIVGHLNNFEGLQLFDRTNSRFSASLKAVECVVTNGTMPVLWKCASHASVEPFLVAELSSLNGTLLGAGDAYAGTFVACRLVGMDGADAHRHAVEQAAKVIQWDVAHVVPVVDIQSPINQAPTDTEAQ